MLGAGGKVGSGSNNSSRTNSGSGLYHTRRLIDIFQSCAENQMCADCGTRLNDSAWASATIGTFICINCASCHRKLGVHISRVKSLHLDTWTDEDIVAMKGGNKHANETYSKYLDKWIHFDENFALEPNAEMASREKWIRAKYEQMQFTRLPELSINEDHKEVGEEEEKKVQRQVHLEQSTNTFPKNSDTRHEQKEQQPTKMKVIEVSKRLVNYFLVLGRGATLPNQNFEKSKSPSDIQFYPLLLDVFPEPLADTPLPSHIGQFAFPEGFSLSPTYIPPIFFSFVLTNINGVKIYASALRFYEELHPLEVVSLLLPSGGGKISTTNQAIELPKWLQELSEGATPSFSGAVFCPKCILVTSHYAYFSAFRQFLLQMYRLTISESPMPIERYITNFVSEIPLPPLGQIQVQLTLPDRTLIISRPPKNELPLVDFSYRALFQVLDINNIIQLFTYATLEHKIVICSKHLALLTPVCETLLSILLPFTWQGAYIPVLPSSLLDVIDAPVPFIVGMHSNCLSQASSQSHDVVFVDLDHNRVIPAVDEEGTIISIPKLPEREEMKLRAQIQEHADIFDPFALAVNKADLAFANEEDIVPIGNFASEAGQTIPLSSKSISESSLADTLYSMSKIMGRGRHKSVISTGSGVVLSNGNNGTNARVGSKSSFSFGSSNTTSLLSSASGSHSHHNHGTKKIEAKCGSLVDGHFNETDDFSCDAVRRAFLRFFVSILKKYASYLNVHPSPIKEGNSSLFDNEGFLENHDSACRPFLTQLLSTQMFNRFCEDRIFHPLLPEVLFFDQSINQKLNRSISLGKKYDCSFLEDKTDDIRETFVAPPPSNIGLPDDGSIYKYNSFPRLKKNLHGSIRKPRELFTSREQLRNVTQIDFHQRVYNLTRNIKGNSASWEVTRRQIIHLQKQYRMYSARKKYLRIRAAVILIQRTFTARMKGRDERLRYLMTRNAAITIQNSYRMVQARRIYFHKLVAVRNIQYITRRFIAASRFKRAIRGFKRLQALWRGSFHKKTYKNLKHQIVRVQSRVRGFLVRSRISHWKKQLFTDFRQKIFFLWKQFDVPLLYRSKFWLTFDQPDFFNLGVYLEEEKRLQASFGDRQTYQHHQDAFEYSTDVSVSNGSPSIILQRLQKFLQRKQYEPSSKVIRELAGARVAQERSKLYETLKYHTSVAVRDSFYEQFHISLKSKKKKRRLSSIVWTIYEDAKKSAEVVVTLSSTSDRYHPLPAQIDRHKQLRISEDLTFTVNAALKSIRVSCRPDMSSHPINREFIELQHQVRMLAAQNHRLMGEVQTSRKEITRLQMELQLQHQPSLRRVSSELSRGGSAIVPLPSSLSLSGGLESPPSPQSRPYKV